MSQNLTKSVAKWDNISESAHKKSPKKKNLAFRLVLYTKIDYTAQLPSFLTTKQGCGAKGLRGKRVAGQEGCGARGLRGKRVAGQEGCEAEGRGSNG